MTAADLERRFLAGLNDAQDAYEQIVATEAWTELGHESFSAWWETAVRPAMRALSMRPTREIAAAVIEKVREEEAELPPAQRRTQRELADLAGTSEWTVRGREDHRERRSAATPDLDPLPPEIADQISERITARAAVADAMAAHLPPDDPWRGWRVSYLRDIAAAYKVTAHQTPDQVAERANTECIEEFRRFVRELNNYADRLTKTITARYGDNVVPFRSAQ